MKAVADTLRDYLAPVIEGMGYEFVGYELQRAGRHTVLRVYIDSTKGITVDDCSRVSRQVSAMLDVEDPIQGNYSLEISSPGIDRPLFELAHFQKQLGKRVKVRMQVPVGNQRNFDGVVQKIEGTNIHLLVDGEERVLPFFDIEKAKVVADIR
jgi:ribosome maturation factor RimP